MKTMAVIGLCVAVLFAAAYGFGAYRWEHRTQALVSKLNGARTALQPGAVDFSELASLPAPAQRYFHAVLIDGQPLISRARLEHAGSFNIGETGEHWKPFVADIKKAHEIFVDDPPWLFIVHDRNARAMTKRVKGFTSAQSWFQDFTPVYME